jgi:transcriptional regulator with XRE-family HTH domain
MGIQGRIGDQFRKRLKAERTRQDRKWSQEDLARMLLDRGVDGIYATTIAKIEAGDRAVRIDELTAMADIFGVSVDTLLGRKRSAQRDLYSLLDALTNAVFLARTELHRTAKTLQDRLEDIPSDYERHDSLAGLVSEVRRHLNAASVALEELVEESIRDIDQRTVKRLKTMSRKELDELSKNIPSAGKDL